MFHAKAPSTIFTNHKPLTHFLDSSVAEGIYARWASELRIINIEIKYIPGEKNTIANTLSRTIFLDPDYKDDSLLRSLRTLITDKDD